MAEALNKISTAGNVQFSYRSDIFSDDKKVNFSLQNKTIKQVLDQLFEGNYHYTERGKYIILHAGGEKQFVISGYIQDGKTGEGIGNVTVYEDQILASTLTNEKGYFRLPIKNKKKLKTISIIARKEAYSESFVDLNAGYDQELILPILPTAEITLEDVVIKNKQEESSRASRFFLSSKQKIQNLNIGDFIAKRPVQTSLLPGIGTHGLIGSQVINKFSLNLLGGYTAGVNGMELGGLFNINKGSVRYFQTAGIFNTVTGKVNGFQIAGISNYVSGNTGGGQVGGINNIVNGKVSGVQIAGISNIVRDSVKGIQVAGISNLNHKETKGIQIAGIVNKNSGTFKGVQIAGLTNFADTSTSGLHLAGFNNHSRASMKGMQVSGFLNYAKKIKGFQLGVINIADSMDGFGLGLLNYYKNGQHKIVVSANEIQSLNVGYLSGAESLYSIVSLGANLGGSKSYSVSYGVGKMLLLSRKIKLNTELAGSVYYLGNWNYVPLTLKLQASIAYQFHKPFELFAGPVYTITETKTTRPTPGYQQWLQPGDRNYIRIGNNISSWIGWQAGIRIF